MDEKQPIIYSSTGVDYGAMDPFKKRAQLRGLKTAGNLARFGAREIEDSRGESAYVFGMEGADHLVAMTIEDLGTKNLVAEKMRIAREIREGGRTFFDNIAQCTAAMILNDVITVGADPMVLIQYIATGSGEWFKDEKTMEDFIDGWIKTCNLAGVASGGGETATLPDIIYPQTADLVGAAVGIIKPKGRLMVNGQKLVPGDTIFLVGSSGIHANGLSLARRVESELPDSYATLLPDGRSYGEALLEPATHIYVGLIRDLFEAGLDLHYAVNITGHGWRKIMRANRPLSYIIDNIPEAQPIFGFIQTHSRNDDLHMYGTFNMGAGFAVFMPEANIEQAQRIAGENHGMNSIRGGYIEEGPRQVVIRPKGITFSGETLGIR